jgi:glycosyltransferase involved in cell wall biosynthesis
MKVWITRPHEDWCVDRMAPALEEQLKPFGVQASSPQDADIVHLLADWCWRRDIVHVRPGTPVVCSVHHIVPEKFDAADLADFQERDRHVTVYHVFNDRTRVQVQALTTKPVVMLPYWLSQEFDVYHLLDDLEKDFALDLFDHLVIGSFQRDTLGEPLKSGQLVPKLEKGPDLLVQALREHVDTHPGQKVALLLAGPRRSWLQLVMEQHVPEVRLINLGRLAHIECAYQHLDEYWVTSRHEGGPQALIECGQLGVPVRSTPCGIAEQVLPPSAIHEDVTQAVAAVPDVSAFRDSARSYAELYGSLVG